MRKYSKDALPLSQVRRYLEPGPVVLVSSSWRGESNIMTLGWHTVMEFTPSLVGCIISNANHSFEMIRRSKECVINLPTLELARAVVDIGNCSGATVDKFTEFGLTPRPGKAVRAPVIEECYAHFECRIYDSRLVNNYNFFIFEVVAARSAKSPKYPKTIHYRGDGAFMVSGENISYKRRFKRVNL